ncbi:type II toxin-antitoxin system PemK/MazF family toxin [Geodermatophilus sp. SYSU D00815]
MRHFWRLIVAAALCTAPVHVLVRGLSGSGAFDAVLGLPGSGAPMEGEPLLALGALPVLLGGVVAHHWRRRRREGFRPDAATVVPRAVRSTLWLVGGGVAGTRVLTLVGLDDVALVLGPLLGAGYPALVGLWRDVFPVTALPRTLRALLRQPVRARPRPADRPVRTGPGVGEIWWADVPFAEVAESKDRPCVVIEASDDELVVLMITSQDQSTRRGYVQIPRTGWDRTPGTSWLRLDRRIPMRRGDFRRYAGPCPAATWRLVQERVLPPVVRSRPVTTAAATAGPLTRTPVPFPELPADPRTFTAPPSGPGEVPPRSAEEALGRPLVVAALQAVTVRARLTGEDAYDAGLVADLRGAAGRGDLPHLWLLAVTECCVSGAALARAALAAMDLEHDEEFARLHGMSTRLMAVLRSLGEMPVAVPAAITSSTVFAPYRAAVRAPSDEIGRAAVAEFLAEVKVRCAVEASVAS